MVKKNKVSIKNVKFGKNVKIIEPVNLYGCEIGDNCFIGRMWLNVDFNKIIH